MRIVPFDFKQFRENVALKSLPRIKCKNIYRKGIFERDVLYYCLGSNSNITHCALYLGKIHSEWDMICYKQFILQFAWKQSYTVETIYSDAVKWVFDLRYDFNIVVDSNDNTLIELNVTPKLADDVTCVCHYTSIENAVEILQSCGFFAKSLNRYNSEKYFNDNVQQRKTVFDVSFCGSMVDNDDMWYNFAKKHKGCKLEFYFKSGLKDAFTANELLKCCNDKEKTLVGYVRPKSLRYRHYDEKELVMPHVYAEIDYQYITYEKKKRNNSNVFITNENSYNPVLNRIAWSAKKEFAYQNEIRIRVLLQSPQRVSLSPFDRIFLPYNMEQIDKINIKVGKNTSDADIQAIMCLVDDEKIFFVGHEE